MVEVLINWPSKLRGILAEIVEHQIQSLCLVYLHQAQTKTALSAHCSSYFKDQFL